MIPRSLAAPSGDDLWELILLAGSLGARVEAATQSAGTRHSSQNIALNSRSHSTTSTINITFFPKKTRRASPALAMCRFVEKQLLAGLDLLGIEAPEMM